MVTIIYNCILLLHVRLREYVVHQILKLPLASPYWFDVRLPLFVAASDERLLPWVK